MLNIKIEIHLFQKRKGDNVKKRANFNFLSILLISVVLLILAAVLCFLTFSATDELTGTREKIEGILQQDEIGDVEGYALLASGGAYAIGAFATGFMIVMCVLIVIAAVALFLPNLIARLVYAPAGGRLIAYRIIMGFEYAFVILFGLLCGSLFKSKLWIAMLSCGYCVMITIIGCINTYTARIKS